MHRRLIHNSYECPRWMEYFFVHLGVLSVWLAPLAWSTNTIFVTGRSANAVATVILDTGKVFGVMDGGSLTVIWTW